MSLEDAALQAAADGFWTFPVSQRSKVPEKGMAFKTMSTRDPAKIKAMWAQSPNANVGIYTGRYADDEALVVLDVDCKKGKDGFGSLLSLELDGYSLPPTRTQTTPSGGQHLVYRTREALRQGVDVIGPGLDVRSRGGYILGAGSIVELGQYTVNDLPIAEAPRWLVDRLGVATRSAADLDTRNAGAATDTSESIERTTRYLRDDAPVAVKGQGGDHTTYRVAARCKDFGLTQQKTHDLMFDVWNPRCPPGWSYERLGQKVAHAYRYGFETPGVADPAQAFEPVQTSGGEGAEPIKAAGSTPAPGDLSPHDKLNREYAYALAGDDDVILRETTDHKGHFRLGHLSVPTFHRLHAAKKITYGNKTVALTEDWIAWPGRRSYDGLVFMPEQEPPAGWYNLWRGFAVEPLADGQKPDARSQQALDAFLEHALTNVCRGDRPLFQWLMGYFAHMIQRPWEKPLVALVFKGDKGVGKNALVERVGNLLGNHFLVATHNRYLTSNFNGHLENLLFMVLDEAAWAGDKKTEGVLKGLITGQSHVIEHKGQAPYSVDNKTRIAVIGNEDWLVPASHDERRFAVFDVGDGRKQDRGFFSAMREGMDAGGNRVLLRFLRQYDISRLDINGAPATRALLDQKTATLEPVPQWWMACLTEGKIAGGDFEGWPGETDCDRMRGAFRRYARERNVKSRLPDDCRFGKEMKKLCPAMTHRRKGNGYVYDVPGLDAARKAWDLHMGYGEEWPQ